MNTAIRRRMSLKFLLLLALIAMALVPIAASAQQTLTFLQLGDIKGSSMDAYHKDWIEVLSLRQTYPVSQRNSCQVEVVKGLDVAGPLVWADAVKGTHIPEARIEVTPANNTAIKIYEIVLKEVVITGVVTAGAPGSISADTGGGLFAETVTLSGGALNLTFTKLNSDGSTGGQVQSSFKCP